MLNKKASASLDILQFAPLTVNNTRRNEPPQVSFAVLQHQCFKNLQNRLKGYIGDSQTTSGQSWHFLDLMLKKKEPEIKQKKKSKK